MAYSSRKVTGVVAAAVGVAFSAMANATVVGGPDPENIDCGDGWQDLSYAASPDGIHYDDATGIHTGGYIAGDTIVNCERITGSAGASNSFTANPSASGKYDFVGSPQLPNEFVLGPNNDRAKGGTDSDTYTVTYGNNSITDPGGLNDTVSLDGSHWALSTMNMDGNTLHANGTSNWRAVVFDDVIGDGIDGIERWEVNGVVYSSTQELRDAIATAQQTLPSCANVNNGVYYDDPNQPDVIDGAQCSVQVASFEDHLAKLDINLAAGTTSAGDTIVPASSTDGIREVIAPSVDARHELTTGLNPAVSYALRAPDGDAIFNSACVVGAGTHYVGSGDPNDWNRVRYPCDGDLGLDLVSGNNEGPPVNDQFKCVEAFDFSGGGKKTVQDGEISCPETGGVGRNQSYYFNNTTGVNSFAKQGGWDNIWGGPHAYTAITYPGASGDYTLAVVSGTDPRTEVTNTQTGERDRLRSNISAIRYLADGVSLVNTGSEGGDIWIAPVSGNSWSNDPANTPPIAVPDYQDLEAGVSTEVDVTGNDSDADGDPSNVVDLFNPQGDIQVTINPDRQGIDVTPDSGYEGPWSVTYMISDGNGGFATGEASGNVSVPVVGEFYCALTALGQYEDTDGTVKSVESPFSNEVYFVDTSPPGGSVSIAWDAVSDSRLTGYRLYCGGATGNYTQSVAIPGDTDHAALTYDENGVLTPAP